MFFYCIIQLNPTKWENVLMESQHLHQKPSRTYHEMQKLDMVVF